MHGSSYGLEGEGLSDRLDGMGPAGEKIYAFPGEAVIFVEISYDYQPLIDDMFTVTETVSATAAFNVRDNRDISQIYQRDPASPDAVASCDKHDGVDITG